MLDDLQQTILTHVTRLPEEPVLFGGAAILAAYAEHRVTYDLDLAWSPAEDVYETSLALIQVLENAALRVERLQTSPRFVRIRVTRGASEATIVDLIAEPRRRPRLHVDVGDARVLVPPVDELLADKLCALLSRQEGRDLWDASELLARGTPLQPSLLRAAELDAGFSPLTLAWVLRSWSMPDVAAAAGWSDAHAQRMAAERDRLVEQLT